MSKNSKIEWTDHTFNPWMGCTKISPACDHCYAEGQTARFKQVGWGPKEPRKRTSVSNWKKVEKWNRDHDSFFSKHGRRQRVFCASLADVFDNHRSITPDWRQDLWGLVEATPNLDWLLLTKRPQNIQRFIPSHWRDEGCPDNVWIGTTAENQEEWDRRWPYLAKVPVQVRFFSCEPLLGPIEMRGAGHLHWMIAGGESGPKFRHADPDWFRNLRDQCAELGVPFLFKQWEGKHQKEIKAKGRELDGTIHDGYPARSAQRLKS